MTTYSSANLEVSGVLFDIRASDFDLSNLQSAQGHEWRNQSFRAMQGALIDLSSLVTVTGNLSFDVADADSAILLPNTGSASGSAQPSALTGGDLIPWDLPGANAVDIQRTINVVLGIDTEDPLAYDWNGDGVVNAMDLQMIINTVLGVPVYIQQPDAGAVQTYARVLPQKAPGDGCVIAAPDAELAIRLRAAAPIDPDTVWAWTVWEDSAAENVDWRPVGGTNKDGWAVYTPGEPWPPGSYVTMMAGAETIHGEEVGPYLYAFCIDEDDEPSTGAPLRQPDYNDFDASALDLESESNAIIAAWPVDADREDTLKIGGNPVYRLEPAAVFDTPQRVWLPLSGGSERASISYFQPDPVDTGWYPAGQVAGWLEPGSELLLDLDGVRYFGFVIRHGGAVRIESQP